MASVTYSGNFNGVSAYAGSTITLYGDAVPSGAILTGISYSLRVKASKYSSSYDWVLEEIAVGGSGGSPRKSGDSATMTSSDHTFSGNMNYSQSDLSKFTGGSFTVWAQAYTTYTSASSYLWDVSVTVEYTFPDNCEPPTSVTINGSSSTVETTASTATLAWSGAYAGTYNSISGYYISVYDSTDGGSSWQYVDAGFEVATSATSGSATVNLPAVGTCRKFKIMTLSAYGTAYGSMSETESPVVIRKEATTACGAPTACSVDVTISHSNATLSWSGATAGYGNAIVGYEVQRCESSDGSSWGSWASLTTTAATSLSVAPPGEYGSYYKYRVRTLGAAGSSYYSDWKTCTNTFRRDHAPLAAFTDTLTAGVTPIKALHMTELQNAVNTLRTFYGLSAYSFTTITAGTTSLGGWSAHVAEIRAAVDEMDSDHEAWISISVNCPRVDVMEQLRRIVLDI